MTRRKVKVFRHSRLDVNALAYYDGDKEEIHILNPQALYRRVLYHELAHARHRGLLGFIWTGQNFMESPLGRGMIWATLLGFLFYYTRLLTITISILGPLPFLFTAIIGCMALGNLLYWAEDIVSEREAIRKTRKPKRDKHHVPEEVLGSVQTVGIAEDPAIDREVSENQLGP